MAASEGLRRRGLQGEASEEGENLFEKAFLG
jgi:hypothetical protein